MNRVLCTSTGDPRHTMKTRTSPVRAAFTLIELMVVIAIIAILATIGLLIANRVTEGGRETQAKQIVRLLDQTLDNYAADRSASKFPYSFTDERKYEFPIIDGREKSTAGAPTDAPEPTVQLFLLATAEAPSVLSAVNGIDGKVKGASGGQMLKLEDVVSPGFGETLKKKDGTAQTAPRVNDPWGNAIRFVHPRFQGGYGKYFLSANGTYQLNSTARADLEVKVKQGSAVVSREFRRSIRPQDPSSGTVSGDADEGLCSGSRPYFYSVGPDGDAGKRKDNVYLEPPQFPSETRKDAE